LVPLFTIITFAIKFLWVLICAAIIPANNMISTSYAPDIKQCLAAASLILIFFVKETGLRQESARKT
jgi:hypothetical protein